jgi:hypothetical protein
MTCTQKITPWFVVAAIWLAVTVVPNSVQAAPSGASMAGMQQQMQAMAADPANASFAQHFTNAANAASCAAAAMGETPANKEQAAAELKDALRVLVDAAWLGADVSQMANQIAGALVELGAFQMRGQEQLAGLLALLSEAQRLKATTEGGSLEQQMAIRELVIALHYVVDNGWHDYWHSGNALRWYINAAGSGTYLPGIIVRLLAFIDSGDYSAEVREQIARMVAELAQGVKDGTISGSAVREALDRISEAIRDEGRRIGQDRKAKAREEAEEVERAEREAARSSGVGGPGARASGPTLYGPYIREVDSDHWKAVITPPIRPPEIVYQVPAGPVGPKAPSPLPTPPVPVGPGPLPLPTPPPAPAPPPPMAPPIPTGPGIGPEPMPPGPPPMMGPF